MPNKMFRNLLRPKTTGTYDGLENIREIFIEVDCDSKILFFTHLQEEQMETGGKKDPFGMLHR